MNLLSELGFYNLKKTPSFRNTVYYFIDHSLQMLLVKGCKIVCLVDPDGSFSRYNFLYMNKIMKSKYGY